MFLIITRVVLSFSLSDDQFRRFLSFATFIVARGDDVLTHALPVVPYHETRPRIAVAKALDSTRAHQTPPD